MKSTMTVTEKEGKLSIVNESPGQDPYEVDSAEIKNGKLLVKSTTDYQGAELGLVLNASIVGDKMVGTLEYDVDGNTGEMSCQGVREKTSKKLVSGEEKRPGTNSVK